MHEPILALNNHVYFGAAQRNPQRYSLNELYSTEFQKLAKVHVPEITRQSIADVDFRCPRHFIIMECCVLLQYSMYLSLFGDIVCAWKRLQTMKDLNVSRKHRYFYKEHRDTESVRQNVQVTKFGVPI